MSRLAVDVRRTIAAGRGRPLLAARSWRSMLYAGAFSAVALGLSSPAALAVNYFRLNPGGGDFRQPAFWTPLDLVPPIILLGPGGAEDIVNFDLGVTLANRYTVTDVHFENDRMLIHNDSLRLEITDYALLNDEPGYDSISFVVGVATGDAADVILTGPAGGNLNAFRTTLAHEAGSTGTVTVTGANWQWDASQLFVGEWGTGTLTIENGATLNGGLTHVGMFANSTGAVTVRGANTNWFAGACTVGGAGTGNVTIEDGGTYTSAHMNLGNSATSNGTITVRGVGSSWVNDGGMFVGYNGVGTLNIEDGGSFTSGTVSLAGWDNEGFGTATVTIAGIGSNWNLVPVGVQEVILSIGRASSGAVTIRDGANLSNAGRTYPGYNLGATGTATVTGAGSKPTNTDDLFVGRDGAGHLTIEARGIVSNPTGWIGTNAGSTGSVTVRDAGTRWTNDGDLFVGSFGAGELTIEAGGLVSNNGTWIGTSPGSTGTATVTGIRSTWSTSGQFIVGYRARGTMTVEAGGSVLNDGDSLIGFTLPTDSLATVTGADSRWTNTGDLVVANSGTGALVVSAGGKVANTNGVIGNNNDSIGVTTVSGAESIWTNSGTLVVGNSGTGTLSVQDGGVVSAAGGMTIGMQGLVTGNGTIVADVTNAGDVAPGNSPGALHITGGFQQLASGHLAIEIGGLLPGNQYDQLLVSGKLVLGGVLDLSLWNGFQPHTGDFFASVYAFDSVAGDFGNINGAKLGGGLQLNPISDATSLGLLAALPGDANLDNVADFSDLGILLNNYNVTGFSGIAQWNAGDFNDDHSVNFSDLGILLNNYNEFAPAFALAAAVPEPSTLALAAFGVLGLLIAARRKGRRPSPVTCR